MYYSLKNIIDGGRYFCRRSEYFKTGTAPHRTYTGIAYLQAEGFEIIGIHKTYYQAAKSCLI